MINVPLPQGAKLEIIVDDDGAGASTLQVQLTDKSTGEKFATPPMRVSSQISVATLMQAGALIRQVNGALHQFRAARAAHAGQAGGQQ